MSIFGIQTQAKKSYTKSNIILHKPLGSLSGNKQDTNKLTKLLKNQQYSIVRTNIINIYTRETLTPYEQAYNEFNQKPAHEMFKILENVQQSDI